MEEAALLKNYDQEELKQNLRFSKINVFSPEESIESENWKNELSKNTFFRLILAEISKISDFLSKTIEIPIESLYFRMVKIFHFFHLLKNRKIFKKAVLVSYQNMSQRKCYYCDEIKYNNEIAGLPTSLAIARTVRADKTVIACHMICQQCYG